MTSATMRAAAWNAAGGLDVVERPVPAPGPGEVLIRVRSAGICGSDLHYFGRPVPFAGQTPGHEIGGTIEACGPGAEFANGEAVVVEGAFACEECHYCRRGYHTHCQKLQFVGFSKPGGIAEYVLAPAAAVYRLPPTVPPEAGALVEPLGISLHGTRRARVAPGDRVLVLGAGTIGLTSLVTARAAGAGHIFATARHPHQAAAVRALGADGVFATSAEALQSLGASSMDVVIETVGGTAPTVSEAVGLVRNLGTICVLGIFEGESGVPLTPVAIKEIDIVGAWGYLRNLGAPDFAISADLLARNLTALQALVTHRFPLGRVQEAFETAHDKSSGSIKVHILP